MKRPLAVAALVALTIGGVCSAVAAASAATFMRGFADDVWFDPPTDGITAAKWLATTRTTGARLVQIEVDWTSVEPSAPTVGESPTNPRAREFNFHYLDTEVSEFNGTGLTPVFLVTDAPRWAEGAGGTADEYATGGYEPNASAFGQLGQALARRYSGSFRLRRRGKPLPRVRYLQAWAEANMSNHLSPQWVKAGGRAINFAPTLYRHMLNAFYSGVHVGEPSDSVLTTGLESYGDSPFHAPGRTHPVTFLENLLCLTARLRSVACSSPARFDVLASDPYDAFAPTVHAVSPLDASAPDLRRLERVVQAAVGAGTLYPRRPKPLWVTEFGYDSDPPNPTAGTVSTATQARWLEESFYVFAHEGASAELWYLVRDQTPPYSENYFSGLYFRDGRPKPASTAYRFPFVVMHTGGRANVWGISPVSGTLQVQVPVGSSWRTVLSLPARAGAIYSRTLALPSGRYRATVQAQRSLVWTYQPARRFSGGRPVIKL